MLKEAFSLFVFALGLERKGQIASACCHPRMVYADLLFSHRDNRSQENFGVEIPMDIHAESGEAIVKLNVFGLVQPGAVFIFANCMHDEEKHELLDGVLESFFASFGIEMRQSQAHEDEKDSFCDVYESPAMRVSACTD